MISFTPRLIPVILASLAHHVPAIRHAANQTNTNLYRVIQNLPSSPKSFPRSTSFSSDASSTQFQTGTSTKERSVPSSPPSSAVPFPSLTERQTPHQSAFRVSSVDLTISPKEAKEEGDPFDYQATVNSLTLQFLNENEETRVAALEWLSMLHLKGPKKVRCCLDIHVTVV
jgi:vacuole morphology and inheritance protein 14